ncbi:uncharacterized oxidoreductase YjmC [Plutella xylostella]|uniref:uncharacterized oxidoreductase YjmC n=1 Tax=Plutella xylostella TaxID=51655 RepID=UPI002032EDC5|nr:uncharacterized oxidoreductase YjmC [Plutella xylostella]XP_048483845.1 uncharacterized oxidoreductase YjmC [Plutella xylostella]
MPEVRIAEVRRFMVDCLVAAGAPEHAAGAHADLLLHADVTGHFSHGLNRLEFYIRDIKSGATDATATPVILKEAAATAWVDGRDALGATVANFCMDLAIRKARHAGVGWVTAKRCCHFGMAGYWALKAEREGLIGLAFTNSSPIMVPTRSRERALGTNPIGMAAPAAPGDSLVVDMATTAVAMGKIEVQIHKGEDIPEGWALGPDGKVTTDAQVAFDTGCLLPLGGSEQTCGYKGYGLSAMVEVFTTALSGAKPTHEGRSWDLADKAAPADLGQCFVAIDPGLYAPGCAQRVAACLAHWRGLQPVDPALPVLVPGDKERMSAEETRRRGTVSYAQAQVDKCNRVAESLGVPCLHVES